MMMFNGSFKQKPTFSFNEIHLLIRILNEKWPGEEDDFRCAVDMAVKAASIWRCGFSGDEHSETFQVESSKRSGWELVKEVEEFQECCFPLPLLPEAFLSRSFK